MFSPIYVLFLLLPMVIGKFENRNECSPIRALEKATSLMDTTMPMWEGMVKDITRMGCIDAYWTLDSEPITKLKECLAIHTVGPALRYLLKDDYMTLEEYHKNEVEVERCYLKETTELLNDNGTLNYANVLPDFYKMEFKGTDVQLLRNMVEDCTDIQREKDNISTDVVLAELSLSSIRECTYFSVIKECNKRNKLDRLHNMVAFQQYFSFGRPGECTSVVVPPKYGIVFNKCFGKSLDFMGHMIMEELAKASGEAWVADEPFPAGIKDLTLQIGTDKMMGVFMIALQELKSNMEEVKGDFTMYFLTCTLGDEGMGFTINGTLYNGTEFVMYMASFKGWDVVYDKLQPIYKSMGECYANFPHQHTNGLFDLTNPTVVKDMISMGYNCIIPHIVDICGMNSDITQLYLPQQRKSFMDYLLPKLKDLGAGIADALSPFIKEMLTLI